MLGLPIGCSCQGFFSSSLVQLRLSLQPLCPISRTPEQAGRAVGPGNLQWGKIVPRIHLDSLIFLDTEGKSKATGEKRLININLKIHSLPLQLLPINHSTALSPAEDTITGLLNHHHVTSDSQLPTSGIQITDRTPSPEKTPSLQ